MGGLFYAALPNNLRPIWAVNVLTLCQEQLPPIPEIVFTCELGTQAEHWSKAHQAFQQIRKLTLKSEQLTLKDSTYHAILYVAENAAKVIYNATIPHDSFDYDCGEWLVYCFRHFVSQVNSQNLEKASWNLFKTWLLKVGVKEPFIREFYQSIQPEGIYQPATYNHAMRAGNTIYVAGQVARDEHGVLVAPNDATGQARKVFENLTRVLEALGADFNNVVKVTTYLTHATDSKAVSDIRLEFFGDHRPPHTGLIVAGLGAPEVRVEVEVIAVLENPDAV